VTIYAKIGLASFSAVTLGAALVGFAGCASAQSDEQLFGAARHSLINSYAKDGQHTRGITDPGSQNPTGASGSIFDNKPCYVDLPTYDKNGKFLGRGIVNNCY
jgi:hypothetical protein